MSRIPDLERSLLRAAQRLEQPAAPPRSHRPNVWRLPLLAVIGTLTLGGGAVAAIQLLPTGDPVPTATDARSGSYPKRTTDVKDSSKVLAVRAADPEGGPHWGLWRYQVKLRTRVEECLLAGRIQGDTIGVVGRDGVFDNDGEFHPLQTRSSATKICGTPPTDGRRFEYFDGPTLPASGYTGAPGPPVGGCRENVSASTMSKYTRRRLRGVPKCWPSGQRIVKFGYAGPDAVKVTYGNNRRTLTVRPKAGDSGAYIFVLRPRDAAGGGALTLTTTHRTGLVCKETRGTVPSPSCTPPPGMQP